MSLKAKIEAVIYASEEPVTLAQLTGLLGHEAQAELDHLDSTQQALALEEAPEQAAPDQAAPDEDELNSEVLANAPGPESQAEAEHAEAIKRHLHDAAAEEAHHAREVRLRTAAATVVVVAVCMVWRDRNVASLGRVALWVEEHEPSLEFSLVTAIETGVETIVAGEGRADWSGTAWRRVRLPARRPRARPRPPRDRDPGPARLVR